MAKLKHFKCDKSQKYFFLQNSKTKILEWLKKINWEEDKKNIICYKVLNDKVVIKMLAQCALKVATLFKILQSCKNF